MPLSQAGVDHVEAAAERVGIGHALLESEALAAYAGAPGGLASPEARVAEQLLASGALAHAPALVVHAGGRVVGPAILGYKTAGAYESAIRRRLTEWERRDGGNRPELEGRSPEGARRPEPGRSDAVSPAGPEPRFDGRFQTVAEHEAVGRPGAYFRWVPGREAIAYESRGRIYLLDLSNGRSRDAPGYVDFVPSPDGHFFVTPAPRRSGMEFYEAEAVVDAVEAGEPGDVDPIYTDRAMQDQYPSVGILEQASSGDGQGSSTVYRVLTSWFEGIRYRDYEATGTVGTTGREVEVRPASGPVEPCRDRRLSIPIMSQDGHEVAARDEATGTTKIFRILGSGRCEEVEDLGVQTGKVAWHWSGRLLAFARPPLRARIGPGFVPGRASRGSETGRGTGDPDLQAADGIFLYDRDARRVTRVPDSEDASALAFPEFIGADRLVYLVPGRSGESTTFRVVEGEW